MRTYFYPEKTIGERSACQEKIGPYGKTLLRVGNGKTMLNGIPVKFMIGG